MRSVAPLVAVLAALIGYSVLVAGAFLMFGPASLMALGAVLFVAAVLVDIKE